VTQAARRAYASLYGTIQQQAGLLPCVRTIENLAMPSPLERPEPA